MGKIGWRGAFNNAMPVHDRQGRIRRTLVIFRLLPGHASSIFKIYFPLVINLNEHWGAHMQSHTKSGRNRAYNYPLLSEKEGISILYDYIYALRGFPESKLKNPPAFQLSDVATESVQKFTTRNSIDYVNILIDDSYRER